MVNIFACYQRSISKVSHHGQMVKYCTAQISQLNKLNEYYAIKSIYGDENS